MTDKNKTEIVMVVDRSGSMSMIKNDAEGGINSLLKDQREADGEANLTLVQFDTKYDFVHKGLNIKDVPEYKLQPRGATALLDAVGQAINETGARLAALAENERPGLVLFVIVTDGQENSSKEFSYKQIAEMIKHQKEKYQWSFTFLGADENTFEVGRSLGFNNGQIAKYALDKMADSYALTSGKIRAARSASSKGLSHEVVMKSMNYTDDEKQELNS